MLLIFSCAALFFFIGHRPFKHLKAADIVSAQVQLLPPDKTIEITDINELVPYLNDIVIYNKDTSYTEYDGQSIIFTLTLSDGTQMEIIEYNPFVIINGIGYKAKYEPCNNLDTYANSLLD